MMIFRSTSSAKELDISTFSPRSTHVDLDPQAPRKSLTQKTMYLNTGKIFRSTSSAKELDRQASGVIYGVLYLDPQAPRKSLTTNFFVRPFNFKDLDPQAPRKSLTARFVINHSECNKKYYLHLIIYRTFIVNCYILF